MISLFPSPTHLPIDWNQGRDTLNLAKPLPFLEHLPELTELVETY